MNIAIGVREARERKGYSQRELSRMIDANASYVNRLESMTLLPSLPMLWRIAHALDVPLVLIFEWSLDESEAVALWHFRERESARIAKAKGYPWAST
jgi:transcriptional regulator with XRE-family HTH domain